MIDTQLILLEGISGSGKSFTSQLLAMQLQRDGHKAQWLYEDQEPQPVYQRRTLDRLLVEGLREHRVSNGTATFADRLKQLLYKSKTVADVYEKALQDWQKLVAESLTDGRVLVMDGGFFQTPLQILSALDYDEETMLAHSVAVAEIIAPLNPVLIRFYQDDIATALADNFSRRGIAFQDYIQDRLEQTPFAKKKGDLTIEQIVLEFFQRYAQIIARISEQLPLSVLSVNTTARDWPTYNAEISDFLAIPLLTESCRSSTPLEKLAGRYQLIGEDDVLDIVVENERLTLIFPTRLRLFHKQGDCFCVEGTLNECCFSKGQNGQQDKLIYSMPDTKAVEFRKISVLSNNNERY